MIYFANEKLGFHSRLPEYNTNRETYRHSASTHFVQVSLVLISEQRLRRRHHPLHSSASWFASLFPFHHFRVLTTTTQVGPATPPYQSLSEVHGARSLWMLLSRPWWSYQVIRYASNREKTKTRFCNYQFTRLFRCGTAYAKSRKFS